MATKRTIAAVIAAAVLLCFSSCGGTEPLAAESAAGQQNTQDTGTVSGQQGAQAAGS